MAIELDTEQQARLSFLEEAETYFEQIEKVILDLNTSDQRLQQLDEAMRAAHSVKGAAGMMGFMKLSQVAHSIEDCFKILRARNLEMEPEVETLLLEGLDCLRAVRQNLYDQKKVEDSWLEIHIELVFDKLRQHLGELTEADENQLLADEEGVDTVILSFTAEVESTLEQLEQILPTLKGKALLQAVGLAAVQFVKLGETAQIDAFVALCRSVISQCRLVSAAQMPELAERALQAWQRSLSLVQLGRINQLPTAIVPMVLTPKPSADMPSSDLPASDPPGSGLSVSDHPAADPPTLELLSSDLSSSDLWVNEPPSTDVFGVDGASSPPDQPIPVISDATVTKGDRPSTVSAKTSALPSIPIEVNTASLETPANTAKVEATVQTQSAVTTAVNAPPASQRVLSVATTRVPVVHLQAINQLIGSLLLDRNAIQLRLTQLQTFAGLLRERVNSIEEFNIQVRQWYDQASMEEMGVGGEYATPGTSRYRPPQPHGNRLSSSSGAPFRRGGPGSFSRSTDSLKHGHSAEVEHLLAEFDALEMDQYSDLHLLAQDQMETIVKLQEVAADVELGLQDLSQSVERLNYTGQVLQKQVNLAQMRPFEDIVGRFPRLIRDLAAEYGKQVKIQITGQSILFERYALEVLTDPLMHLVRNAFDHGIEDPMTRQTAGKSLEGTIQLQAMNRGNRAVITVKDDGRGINVAKIRDRAHEHGIPDDKIQQMSREELLNLIFEPGFTTADQLTELSGRGVGMDVVRANLKAINGDIKLETEWGKGTAFTISIPLSLSLLRVVLLEQANMVFALPAGDIREMITLNSDHIIINDNQEAIVWRETAIPLVRIEQHWPIHNKMARPMQLNGNPLIDRPLVVVLGEESQCFAMAIARFWQEEEVAIRPLSSPLPLPPGFNGTTLSGDGRVIPLVDPFQLWNWMRPQVRRRSQSPSTAAMEHYAADTPMILVVDDSIHARRYLVLTLTKAGYITEQAKDGHEALDLLKSGLPIQAVICDVEMPRMDGYGVLDAIRNHPQLVDLPVIMLTSRSSEKHRKLAMNLGASAYFSKPYNEQQLLQTLANQGVQP